MRKDNHWIYSENAWWVLCNDIKEYRGAVHCPHCKGVFLPAVNNDMDRDNNINKFWRGYCDSNKFFSREHDCGATLKLYYTFDKKFK